MSINLSRIWSIVNTVSGEVLYSTTQYTLAKKHYDYLLQLRHTDKNKWHKLFCGDFGCEFLQLYRYDLSRHYIEPTFGSCLKKALIETLPGSSRSSLQEY